MAGLAEQAPPEGSEAGWYADPLGSGKERFWDREWTDQIRKPDAPAIPPPPAPAAPIELTPRTPEERKSILAQRVQYYVGKGYRVESQTDFQAVLVTGHRPNHILHLILSIVTAGLWLIVWLIVGLASGERRKVVSIDEYGQSLETKG